VGSRRLTQTEEVEVALRLGALVHEDLSRTGSKVGEAALLAGDRLVDHLVGVRVTLDGGCLRGAGSVRNVDGRHFAGDERVGEGSREEMRLGKEEGR
jgi:hypothetical protein